MIAREIEKILDPVARPLEPLRGRKPHVVLVTGVNGSGKTTTIGKLAHYYKTQGLKVMLAAGDTFRAAAIEQLKIWGGRTGSKVIAGNQGGDAASLAFEAVTAAKNDGADVLIVDTAGRLQNRAELMNELEKVVRVIKKVDASAPHAVLLVLDATVGQNALSQVEVFGKTAGVTGLVMTKLDRAGEAVLSSRLGLSRDALEVRDDLGCWSPTGNLAGSGSPADRNVALITTVGGVPLTDAARMGSTVPAMQLGLGASKGRIAPGFDADLCALAPVPGARLGGEWPGPETAPGSDRRCVLTVVAGEVVYQRDQ